MARKSDRDDQEERLLAHALETLRGHTAAFARDMRQYRKTKSIVGIRIMANEGARCSASVRNAGAYRLDDAPKYPFPGCDAEPCCVCWWIPIFVDELPGEAGWKPKSVK
jgi:hypothetical protein